MGFGSLEESGVTYMSSKGSGNPVKLAGHVVYSMVLCDSDAEEVGDVRSSADANAWARA